MRRLAAVLLIAACMSGAGAVRVKAHRQSAGYGSRANPIRRIVDLLQQMQKKVTEEGEAEKQLFDAFMCYCKNGDKELQEAIEAAEVRLEQTAAKLEEAQEQSLQRLGYERHHLESSAGLAEAELEALRADVEGLRVSAHQTAAKDVALELRLRWPRPLLESRWTSSRQTGRGRSCRWRRRQTCR